MDGSYSRPIRRSDDLIATSRAAAGFRTAAADPGKSMRFGTRRRRGPPDDAPLRRQPLVVPRGAELHPRGPTRFGFGPVPPSTRNATQGGVTPRARRARISPREVEVLAWVAEGKTNPEIGAILGLSSRTVGGIPCEDLRPAGRDGPRTAAARIALAAPWAAPGLPQPRLAGRSCRGAVERPGPPRPRISRGAWIRCWGAAPGAPAHERWPTSETRRPCYAAGLRSAPTHHQKEVPWRVKLYVGGLSC